MLTAPDGAQAMGVFAMHQDEIAVVLTDMMMPVMDGAALITALRRIDPSVPVIATSGVTSSGMYDRRAEVGAQAFLPKPYSAQRLLATLGDVLADRAAARGPSAT